MHVKNEVPAALDFLAYEHCKVSAIETHVDRRTGVISQVPSDRLGAMVAAATSTNHPKSTFQRISRPFPDMEARKTLQKALSYGKLCINLWIRKEYA